MYQLSLHAVFSMIAAIFSLAIGLFVLLKYKGSPVNFSFFLLALSSFIWQLGNFFLLMSTEANLALSWIRFGFVGITLVPITTYHLIVNFLKLPQKKKFIITGYLIAVFLCIPLSWTRYFFSGVNRYPWGYWYKAGIYHPFFLVFFVSYMIVSFYKLFVAYKKEYISLEKMRKKYLLIALIVAYIGASDYIPTYGIEIYPLGFLAVIFGASLIAYGIYKYRLMDVNIVLARTGIFLFVYTFILGIPFFLGYVTRSWLISTSLAVVLATLGPFVFNRLRRKAEDVLLAQQRQYQRVLLQAAAGMVREHNLERLVKLMVHVVKRAVKIEFAAVFLDDKENERYVLKAIRDHQDIAKDIEFSYAHPLVTFIREKKTSLVYEEIAPLLEKPLVKPIHLLVPSFVQDELLGFIVLGEKRDRTIYTQDDINVFEILSRQAALAISHCLFLEEFKQAQERIFQAEKLASIGGMASGVAHQIRNRLNHFSVAAGEQKFEIEDFMKDNPQLVGENPNLKKSLEYLVKTADSIVGNVKRTASIIQGILNFARAKTDETKAASFPFEEAVQLTISPLETKHSISQFPLEMKLDAPYVIWGIKAQLVEVILNILDNAYEAIQEKQTLLKGEDKKEYRPLIKLTFTQNETVSRIKIADNGIGVKEEDKRKIFAPFFTTKSSFKSGTGIGMYVVRRIVEENHNGRIWFDSEYMRGTTFYIELPKKEKA